MMLVVSHEEEEKGRVNERSFSPELVLSNLLHLFCLDQINASEEALCHQIKFYWEIAEFSAAAAF
jgi:hypothetical protein